MNMELEKLRFNFHRLLGASSPPLLRNCQGSVFPCFCNYKLRFMFPMDCLGDIWEEPVFNNTEDPWRSNQENSCPWSKVLSKTSTWKPWVVLWPPEPLAGTGSCWFLWLGWWGKSFIESELISFHYSSPHTEFVFYE